MTDQPQGPTPTDETTLPSPEFMADRTRKFREELETLINRHSRENGSDTPDFLLAEYLVAQLNLWDQYVTRREQWYGRKTAPANNGG